MITRNGQRLGSVLAESAGPSPEPEPQSSQKTAEPEKKKPAGKKAESKQADHEETAAKAGSTEDERQSTSWL